ncbi:MAG: glycine cleavage system protein GcvH [Deltaproteobacteria bacterium]|nr:glycine cleavage system protein GcvH [Deltaproteobacteria bacterium]
MEIPEDLLYTEQHEWAHVEEKIVTVGITDFAQSQLGDIVYLDLPKEGTEVSAEDTFGVVESVKAVSDLYAPVSGRVVDVNTSLADSPSLVNDDPYNEGWMIKIQMDSAGNPELKHLLASSAYEELVEGQESSEDGMEKELAGDEDE